MKFTIKLWLFCAVLVRGTQTDEYNSMAAFHLYRSVRTLHDTCVKNQGLIQSSRQIFSLGGFYRDYYESFHFYML